MVSRTLTEGTLIFRHPREWELYIFFGVGNDGKGGPTRDTVLHTLQPPVHLDLKGGELDTDPLLDGTARYRTVGDFSSLLLSYLIVSTLEIDICSHSPLLSKHAII